ncbi:hypothetical protein C8R42DRAFT_697291 [Lentinula raphanica]|nr:hypothetical protein C8R42DRAFT_697291 [Lentinula raphanica]
MDRTMAFYCWRGVKQDTYSPFSSCLEWEVSHWAVKEKVSQSSFNRLLQIPQIKEKLGLSFDNARSMLNKVDQIPERCSGWLVKQLSFKDRPQEEFTVRYRDPIKVIKALWGDPSFSKDLVYRPAKLFRKLGFKEEDRIYSEMWTGSFWNKVQGGTVAPVILATDKTQLTQFSGSKSAYPVYLTIGNIPKNIRRKPGSRACILLAYLSVDKIVKKGLSETQIKLRNYQLFHTSMALILGPLKAAGNPAGPGVEMVGVYPVLATYIADYPEQCVVTCTKYCTCPKCQRKAKELHQTEPGEPRTQRWSYEKISDAQKAAKEGGRSVHSRMMKDNIAGGIISLSGLGVRHFAKGISNLTQMSGLERKHISRILLSCLVGKMDQKGITACRSILHFIQLAQYPSHNQETLQYMKDELDTWHKYRDYFIDQGAREHFNIPKFHSLLHYVDSIHWIGTTNNSNTEAFERLHIDFAKEGWRASNKRDHFPQMEKISSFDFYQTWSMANSRKTTKAEDLKDGVLSNPRKKTLKNHTEPRKKLSAIALLHGAPGFIGALKLFLNNLLPKGEQRKKATALGGLLPFTTLEVWHNFTLIPASVLDETEKTHIKARPLSSKNKSARFDTVIVLETDDAQSTAVRGEEHNSYR